MKTQTIAQKTISTSTTLLTSSHQGFLPNLIVPPTSLFFHFKALSQAPGLSKSNEGAHQDVVRHGRAALPLLSS